MSTEEKGKAIKSPTCSKRFERIKFWLDQTNNFEDVGKNAGWAQQDIDWSTITMEDRICMSIIDRAINKAEYAVIVAIQNSRYGMLKGGDYVDDGSSDEVKPLFGFIDG